MPDPDRGEEPSETAVVTCRGCGRQARPPALGWSHQTGGEWLCERCSRDNLRNIEANLDTEWW